MSISKQISLSLPAEANYIDIARLTLYGISNKMGFSYEDIEDMKVAIAEACNNVVLHAYQGVDKGTIDINFEMSETKLIITVSDNGASFDYEPIAEHLTPHHNKSLDEITAGGLGIYLMQALMDQVDVKSDKGTTLILTKYLQPIE
ncbi:MAG: anti-sigma B factor RsbW [Gorillibacterium sp.]|nr:anti-sigma B factor RsbW [Gorillibacterium sp.]